MYAIAAKSCAVNLSGYLPRHEAATYVFAAGLGSEFRGSTALAYPNFQAFSAYNPTDSQLAQLLFNPAVPFATPTNAMTVQAFAETALPESTALALERVGIHPGGIVDNLIGFAPPGAGVVRFVASAPESLVEVTVVVDRSPISVPVQLEGSKCYFAASVVAKLDQFYDTKTYPFGPLGSGLLPSAMAAEIDPQVGFEIAINDAAPLAAPAGGNVRTGVVRVTSPYYAAAGVNPFNSINSPAASVFNADVRANKSLPTGAGSFARVGAGTAVANAARRLSIAGQLGGTLQLFASARSSGGQGWFPYTPTHQRFPEWGVNPTYKPRPNLLPTVEFQAASVQYGTVPVTQDTTIEVALS